MDNPFPITRYSFVSQKALYRKHTDGIHQLLSFDIVLMDSTKQLWSIFNGGSALNSNFEWEYMRMPSSRTDEQKNRTRFTLEEAVQKAKELIALHDFSF